MMPAHRVTPNEYVYKAYAAVYRRAKKKEKAAEIEAMMKTDSASATRGQRQGVSHEKKAQAGSMPQRVRMCRFFLSPQGCRNGESCPFLHDAPVDNPVWAMISGYAGP